MTSLDAFLNGPEQAERLKKLLNTEKELDALFSEKMEKLRKNQSVPESGGEDPGTIITTPAGNDISNSENIDEKIELKKKIYDFKKTCWEMENARLNRSLAEFAAIFTAGGFLIPYWTSSVSSIKKDDPSIMPYVIYVVGFLFVVGFGVYFRTLPKRHRSATRTAGIKKSEEQPPG